MGAENLGRWDDLLAESHFWIKGDELGDARSYGPAAQWLLQGGCRTVADWGCGLRGAEKHFPGVEYVGVDGSQPKGRPQPDVVADLAEVELVTEGVMMRHVLEHCRDWEAVLGNAIGSFTKRMSLVTFRPLRGRGEEIRFGHRRGILTQDLPRDSLLEILTPHLVSWSRLDHQTLFFLERK